MEFEQQNTYDTADQSLVSASSFIESKKDRNGEINKEVTRPWLNTIIMLRILSYTNPETVCRFSRTCSWAKELVEANINRLPRLTISFGRIMVTRSSATYDLTVHANFKIQEKTEIFDTQVAFNRISYVVVRNFSLTYEMSDPSLFASTVENVISAAAIPDLVHFFMQPSGSITVAHSCFNSDASFLAYLQDFAATPFEAIFERNVSVEGNRKIRDILVMAFQSSFYTELDLSSACRTTKDCFVLLVDVLKVLKQVHVDKMAMQTLNNFWSFPKIVFRTTDATSHFFSLEERIFLISEIERNGLASFCKPELNFDPITLKVAPRKSDVRLVVTVWRGTRKYINELSVRVADKHFATPVIRLQHHMERPCILRVAMRELHDLMSQLPWVEKEKAIHQIVAAMKRYPEDVLLQISGENLLRELRSYVEVDEETLDQITDAVLSALETHVENKKLVDGCVQLLLSREAVRSLERVCQRAARVLSGIIEEYVSNNLGEAAIAILDNMTWREAQPARETGVIEAVLHIIDFKRESNMFDTTLETACRFLLNATDLSPENCKWFLDANGLQIFWRCCRQLQDKKKLPVDVIGTMGNVAEVKELRYQLMKDEYIDILCTLSTDTAGNADMSFIATGILVQLVGDGDELWTGLTTSRQRVMETILEAIAGWDIYAEHNFNYDSLKPFLDFLPMFDSPACQLWAVWGLANLTSTEKNRYCTRLEEEGGTALLDRIQKDVRTPDSVRQLASVVFGNICAWKLMSR